MFDDLGYPTSLAGEEESTCLGVPLAVPLAPCAPCTVHSLRVRLQVFGFGGAALGVGVLGSDWDGKEKGLPPSWVPALERVGHSW